MTTTPPTQRWLSRRQSFNDDPRFDPSIHGVEPLRDRLAKDFVETHHYSASYPAAILAAGLMRIEAGRSRLVGTAVFSVPIQPRAAAAYGAGTTPFCDLGRFCLLDHVEANAETWFLRRALSMLAKAKAGPDGRPAYPLVIAYADPVARTDRHGETTMPGHVGHIYGAAGSATYLGRATARTLILDQDGRVISERTLSKLRTGERGWEAAYRAVLAKGGATPPTARGRPRLRRARLVRGAFPPHPPSGKPRLRLRVRNARPKPPPVGAAARRRATAAPTPGRRAPDRPVRYRRHPPLRRAAARNWAWIPVFRRNTNDPMGFVERPGAPPTRRRPTTGDGMGMAIPHSLVPPTTAALRRRDEGPASRLSP